jgi:phospholipid/cholesterol/gamma-HCH transport system ATP-binding protein
VVTHDVPETLAIADRIYLLAEGRIMASGTPDALKAAGDPFVTQFFSGAKDGPVQFHQPAPPMSADLGLDR